VLAELRGRIQALERGIASFSLSSSEPSQAFGQTGWTLGLSALERRLPAGLDPAALHEVKPEMRADAAVAGDWAAALGFALRLALCRLQGLDHAPGAPRILWCWPAVLACELGQPHGHGLSALGLEPSTCLFVETARPADALWAMEEGLRSGSMALVIGVLDEAELTPTRRLSLAAAEQRTPCLLVTHPRLPAAGSTATRWRVGARGSGPHAFDASAPGAARYALTLERCRHGPLAAQPLSLLVEWSDETHRFRMAAAMADRAPAPRRTGRGAA
jgi:protein ImuA